MMRVREHVGAVLAAVLLLAGVCAAQSLPQTAGEPLTGGRVVVAEEVRGRTTVLVGSFSREAGDRAAEWVRALRADPALARVQVLNLVMLERAPGLLRGLIKRTMRKGMSPAEQQQALILTADEAAWRSYFGVSDEKDAWVVALDAGGKVVWHGHGRAQDLEGLVRAAVK